MKTFGIILISIAILLFAGCRKCHNPADKDCSNYNPCYGQQAVTANFKIYEQPDPSTSQYFLSKWVYYDTDSVLTDLVTFKADITDANYYEWHIGTGVYHTDTVTLNFSMINQGSIIPIELIIQKTPDTICFPKDKGIDTVTRYMQIDSLSRGYNRHLGLYQGHFTDAPNDSIFFNFYNAIDTNSKQLMTYAASNYFPTGVTSEGGFLPSAEREFVFGGDINFSFGCLVYTDSTGLTTIYTEESTQSSPIQRTFFGRKN